MTNYSENEGKQYHIQVGRGDVGRYVTVSYTHLTLPTNSLV